MPVVFIGLLTNLITRRVVSYSPELCESRLVFLRVVPITFFQEESEGDDYEGEGSEEEDEDGEGIDDEDQGDEEPGVEELGEEGEIRCYILLLH